MPMGRELEQDGAQTVSQGLDAVEKEAKGGSAFFQLLEMGDKTAGFHRETEARRSGIPPTFEGRLGGQSVKAVVDFDGREEVQVMVQEKPGRRLGRIEVP